MKDCMTISDVVEVSESAVERSSERAGKIRHLADMLRSASDETVEKVALLLLEDLEARRGP